MWVLSAVVGGCRGLEGIEGMAGEKKIAACWSCCCKSMAAGGICAVISCDKDGEEFKYVYKVARS
eukprot:765988-Hanusia_phi.AAC.24